MAGNPTLYISKELVLNEQEIPVPTDPDTPDTSKSIAYSIESMVPAGMAGNVISKLLFDITFPAIGSSVVFDLDFPIGEPRPVACDLAGDVDEIDDGAGVFFSAPGYGWT